MRRVTEVEARAFAAKLEEALGVKVTGVRIGDDEVVRAGEVRGEDAGGTGVQRLAVAVGRSVGRSVGRPLGRALAVVIAPLIPARAALGALRVGLFVDLLKVAERRGLVVAWSTTERIGNRDRAGRLPIGWYDSETQVILLAPGHWLDPWTLAHEIGHHDAGHASAKEYGPKGEVVADAAGRRIIEGLIKKNPWRLEALSREMDAELPVAKGKVAKASVMRRRGKK